MPGFLRIQIISIPAVSPQTSPRFCAGLAFTPLSCSFPSPSHPHPPPNAPELRKRLHKPKKITHASSLLLRFRLLFCTFDTNFAKIFCFRRWPPILRSFLYFWNSPSISQNFFFSGDSPRFCKITFPFWQQPLILQSFPFFGGSPQFRKTSGFLEEVHDSAKPLYFWRQPPIL